jgi:hypothetical protein
MQYQVAAMTMFASFGLALAGESATAAGVVGMGFATYGWPILEYCNHRLLHTSKSARHAHHHVYSRDYPEIRANLGPAVVSFHIGSTLVLWWFSSALALGYSGTIALLYACYEGAHEGGHFADVNMPSMTWAVRNSHAWHWQHHLRPTRNFGVSTPFYDLMEGTADLNMIQRYNYGWRKWVMPIPWLVFALTPPDPNAPYDGATEAARQARSAEARARRRRMGGSLSAQNT